VHTCNQQSELPVADQEISKRGTPKNKVSAPSSFITNAALYTGKGHLLKNTQGNE